MPSLAGAASSFDAGQSALPREQAGAQSSDRLAEAYEQFLLARRLEGEQDQEGAEAAYRRAMELDPGAADIPASLADLYMRVDRIDDAIAVAEQALGVDPASQEAHRVLGLIYSSRTTTRGSSRSTRQQNLELAIQHLEQAVEYPPGGPKADVNVRAMLARLYYGAQDYDKAVPLLAEIVKEEQRRTEPTKRSPGSRKPRPTIPTSMRRWPSSTAGLGAGPTPLPRMTVRWPRPLVRSMCGSATRVPCSPTEKSATSCARGRC
jgi:tetratricopeptide (TPR) repeat protein